MNHDKPVINIKQPTTWMKQKTTVNTAKKTEPAAISYSDILSCDNSLIMNGDIDELENESSKFFMSLKLT